MAFVGRVLLRNIGGHVQKTRVLSAALRWQRLPAIAMTPTRMVFTTCTSVNEGRCYLPWTDANSDISLAHTVLNEMLLSV